MWSERIDLDGKERRACIQVVFLRGLFRIGLQIDSWLPYTHLPRRPPEKIPVCLGLVLCRSPVASTEALVDRVVAVGVGLVKRGGNARVCGLAGVVQLDSALVQSVRLSDRSCKASDPHLRAASAAHAAPSGASPRGESGCSRPGEVTARKESRPVQCRRLCPAARCPRCRPRLLRNERAWVSAAFRPWRTLTNKPCETLLILDESKELPLRTKVEQLLARAGKIEVPCWTQLDVQELEQDGAHRCNLRGW